MTNEQVLLPIFKKLYQKIITNDFVIDKSGVKLVELIGERIDLDPTQMYLDFGVRKSPKKYIEKELNWYKSQSLSIKNYVDEIEIWKQVCSKDSHQEINSNYGWMVYSDENYNQFNSCINTLIGHKESRRATMIYQRPSMQIDYKRAEMSDFVCTYFHQFFIRNNKLVSIYSMRSQDGIYGFFNDFAWACYIQTKVFNKLKKSYLKLVNSSIIWQASSFHLYERHFKLLEEIVKENE